MTDYSRMKVVELKAELKRLGLPQNGLKAELISRLEEAQASDNAQPATSELPAEAPTTTEPDEALPSEQAGPADDFKEPPETESQTELQGESLSVIAEDSAENVVEAQVSLTTTSETQSVPPTETVQDAQKRKRRSTTPLPSDDVSRKRLRQDDAEAAHDATLDSAASRQENLEREQEAATDEARIPDVEIGNAQDGENTEKELDLNENEGLIGREPAYAFDANEEAPLGEAGSTATEPNHSRAGDAEDSVMVDAGATSHPSEAYSVANDTLDEETRDHKIPPSQEPDVEASIHPATCALYIKNFMRPLRDQAVREHLLELATPANTPFDPSIVVDFYLDSIRTHAFAVFASIAAASRVRAALHKRVWPDETNRKALWVDFMPSHCFEEWVDTEQQARNKGNMPRYEVVYDRDDDGNVMVNLEETDGNQATRRGPISPTLHPDRKASIPTGPSRSSGIENAPTGPRNLYLHNGPSAMHPSRQDRLESGFIRTKCGPPVLYRPVPAELAQRRLDCIVQAKDPYYTEEESGKKEYHRYYFERDDILVNRGPEIFLGIRPPHREKGRQLGRAGRNPHDHNMRSRRGPPGRSGGGGGGGGRRRRRGPRPHGVPRGGDRFRPSSSYDDRSALDDRRLSRRDSYGEATRHKDNHRY
ncbi:hypothetical protein GGS21DRAFT_93339 [Xylaria nigripes]|nr:hypothetical protein GGS21DRAFT_93339 [Xylaria nigripes]